MVHTKKILVVGLLSLALLGGSLSTLAAGGRHMRNSSPSCSPSLSCTAQNPNCQGTGTGCGGANCTSPTGQPLRDGSGKGKAQGQGQGHGQGQGQGKGLGLRNGSCR